MKAAVTSLFLLILIITDSVFAEDGGSELLIKGATVEAPLSDLALSASVFSPEDLQDRGVDNLADAIPLVPNLNYSGGTSTPQFFQIRGIGELEQYEGAPNPSVGLIIDGIDLSGLGGAATFFDVSQLEVLRGPQVVRYGSSALAGAIALYTAEPTKLAASRGELSIGNEDYFTAGVAVGGPIVGTNQNILTRISVHHSYSNGYRDNLFLDRDDTNEREETTLRGKVKILAGPETSIELGGFYVQLGNGYDAFAIDNSYNTQSDRPGEDHQGIGAGSLLIQTKLDRSLSLLSRTAVLRGITNYSFDGDWGNNPFWDPYSPYDYFSDSHRRRDALQQELRVQGDKFTAGIFGQRLFEDTSTHEFSDNFEYDSLKSDYSAGTIAAFGDLEVPLTEQTALSFGLRNEYRVTDYSDSKGAEFSPNYNMLGGVIALKHKLSEQFDTYLSLTRGFKGGGVNPGPSVPDDRKEYDPEYQWSLETGLKGSFYKGDLITNLSVFAAKREDQQLKLAIQDDPSDPLAFTYLTDSGASGQAFGLEFDAKYRVSQQLKIFSSIGLLSTKFTEVPTELAALDGRDSSHAPNWQYSFGAEQLLGNGFFVRADVTGMDSFYFDDSHNEKSSSYALVNAGLGYRHGRWSLTTWIKNIFDKEYAVRGFYFGTEPPDYPNKEYVQLGDPQQIGITLRYEFS